MIRIVLFIYFIYLLFFFFFWGGGVFEYNYKGTIRDNLPIGCRV